MTAASPRTGWDVALVLCVLLGMLLRGWAFHTGDSLWLDELFLANNIQERSWRTLLEPLSYGQNAPVGWLLLQDAWVEWFGASTASFRGPALVASLVSVGLTAFVARRLLAPAAAVWATAAVSLSPDLLWLTMQAKQYAFDVVVALLLWTVAFRMRRWLWLVALGVVAPWFSMPAVFVLAGVGVVLGVDAAVERDRERLLCLAGMVAAWSASFAVNYLLFLQPREQAEWLFDYWSPGLMPWPPTSSTWTWAPRVIVDALEDPMGLTVGSVAAAVVAAVGVVFAWRSLGRVRSMRFAMLVCPVGATIAAGVVGQYPFHIRLVAFLVPVFAVAVGLGLQCAAQRAPRLAFAAGVALLVAPLGTTLVWVPRGGLPIASDSRALVEAVARHVPPGDRLVVDAMTTHAWRFLHPDRPAVLAQAAWNDESRVASLRDALDTLDETVVWLAVTRVTKDEALPVGSAVAEDVAARAWSAPRSYRALVAQRTGWPTREEFELALVREWSLEAVAEVRGGVLWRATRVTP